MSNPPNTNPHPHPHPHPNPYSAAHPVDPYQWRESVLSTRSLSYASTADFFSGPASRNASVSHHLPQPPLSRRSTLDSEAGGEGEMSGAGGAGPAAVAAAQAGGGGGGGGGGGANPHGLPPLHDIPELPSSVAGSLLFTLPREIRDRIYAFCLTAHHNTPIDWPPPLPSTHSGPTTTPTTPGKPHPQLLRTCHPIHAEAAPLLYSLNPLTFHHPTDANLFARALASPALVRAHTTHLHLSIRAADTRLWMPYLTSTDRHRSLRADFPAAREVSVRFRSQRWSHSAPLEVNLRGVVAEDAKVLELVEGLRHVFLEGKGVGEEGMGKGGKGGGGVAVTSSRGGGGGGGGGGGTAASGGGGGESSRRSDPEEDREEEGEADTDTAKPLNEMNEAEFMRFVDARRPGEDMAFKRQLLDLHKAHAPSASADPSPFHARSTALPLETKPPPTLKVKIVCRLNPVHFTALTTAAAPVPTTPSSLSWSWSANHHPAQHQQPPPTTTPNPNPNPNQNYTPGGPAAILAQALGGGAAAGHPSHSHSHSNLAAAGGAEAGVRDGDAFRGFFTPQDFRATAAAARSACTPWVVMEGVRVALEVQMVEGRRGE